MRVVILILCRKVNRSLYSRWQEIFKERPSSLDHFDLYLVSDKKPKPYFPVYGYGNEKEMRNEVGNGDQELNIIFYPTAETIRQGFHGSTSFIECCAWDKGLRYLIRNANGDSRPGSGRRGRQNQKVMSSHDLPYDFAWLIEDDVFFRSNGALWDMIRAHEKVSDDFVYSSWFHTPDTCPKWSHWPKAAKLPSEMKDTEDSLAGSLNVICRLSRALILKLAEAQKSYHRLWYQELWFATTARHHLFKRSRLLHPYNLFIQAGHSRSKHYDKDRILKIFETGAGDKPLLVCHPYKKWWQKFYDYDDPT